MRIEATLQVPRLKPDQEPRDDATAKIDKGVLRLAKAIASFRGITLAEYLSETLRPIVTRDFDEMPRARKTEESAK